MTGAGWELAKKIENLEPPKENLSSTNSESSGRKNIPSNSVTTDMTNLFPSENHSIPFQSDLATWVGTVVAPLKFVVMVLVQSAWAAEFNDCISAEG